MIEVILILIIGFLLYIVGVFVGWKTMKNKVERSRVTIKTAFDLLIESESMLSDRRAGQCANELAFRIIEFTTPLEDEIA